MDLALGKPPAVSFTVPGPPVPRHLRIAQRPIKGYPGHYYKARLALERDSEAYQVRLARAAHEAFDAARLGQLSCLVSLRLVLVFRRKKGLPPGRQPYGVNPDGDKVLRNVKDALQLRGITGKRQRKGERLGVLYDDNRVQSALVEKYYAAEDEGPCTEITIQPL